MNEKWKNRITVIIMGAFLLGMSLWCWLKPAADYSDSERRILAKLPEISGETLLSGEFMSDFETYSADQFPMRDSFRTVKSFSALRLFRQLDTDGLYEENGFLSKTEYPLNKEMLSHASEVFRSIYDTYLAQSDTSVYFSIVPDKNYFLAGESNRLALDYDLLVADMREQTDYMQYIDIFPLLELEDYYHTDTHWKQECIMDVASEIAEGMGTALSSSYETKTLDNPFYGVYYGQLALPTKPDTIRYLTNDVLDNCSVTSYNTGVPVQKAVYDMEKAYSKDPYEMFLSGADPLIIIENPSAETERELVIFRDSFASSLAPLLVEAYSKITLIDVRYMNSSMIGNFVEFGNQDVLFIYSTLILNNSLALK